MVSGMFNDPFTQDIIGIIKLKIRKEEDMP